MELRELAINGGQVERGDTCRLVLPASTTAAYMDAQVDDYGGRRRRSYPWYPGVTLELQARFSHERDSLLGTAGFGFWNAPFGDPTVRWPALPQAAWFFYASSPTDLPLAKDEPGRGWFAGTIDMGRRRAWQLAPLALPVLLLNQITACRRRVWPAVQRQLGISFETLPWDMREWHTYQLSWQIADCTFTVDGVTLLQTPFSPRGPLGFVCWMDNQYLAATARGRVRAGILPIPQPQWLELAGLTIKTSPPNAQPGSSSDMSLVTVRKKLGDLGS